MKKHCRSLALLLGILILLSVAACSGGGSENTSDPDTDTRTPETTDIISAATTEEPSVSASVPPETTSAEITEDTAPEITFPPEANDVLRVLMQKNRGEALTSLFADGEEKALLDEREGRLLREHLLDIEITATDDIASRVRDSVLASQNEYDLLLLTPADGITLLTDGMLEKLSEAGIGINPDSLGIGKSLTESLRVGGGSYLLACDALVSDLSATYALRYNGAALSSDPVTMAMSGSFTAELMITYISELGDSAFSTENNTIAIYTALGGRIFMNDGRGLPISALTADTLFAEKYSAASSLVSKRSEKSGAVFTVSLLSTAEKGEIYLPLPKLNVDSKYCSLADAGRISLLAAPAGVIDGVRLSKLISAFNMSSSDYRESIRASLTANSEMRGEKLLEIIEDSAVLDLGILLGWGDIDDLIESGIVSGKSADSLLSDRITEMRNKAVETAANIIADRLGIK